MSALTYLHLQSTGVTGDVGSLSGLTGLTSLYLGDTGVAGDFAGLGGLAALTILDMFDDTGVTGDVGGICEDRGGRYMLHVAPPRF